MLLTMGFASLSTVIHSDFAARAKDWRNGAIVYQVFVDRFAPPTSLSSKSKWIKAPRELMSWDKLPVAGHAIDSLGLWSHELQFWGGDLPSLSGKLDYIHRLGADVVYLTPIFESFTNHRYDTLDYSEIAPELGARHDLEKLAQGTHRLGMRLVLDGVFNHMGKKAAIFQDALADTKSKYRGWFFFDKRFAGGYRGWSGVANLPVLKLENPKVRDYLWNGQNSIVRRYLRDGVDGWRLDVAFEIGPSFLRELTQAAHETEPGSCVVGEISGYPSNWFPAVDGVFNFFALETVKRSISGEIDGGRATRILGHMVDDAGIENLLKSWLITDNHDTPRLATVVPDFEQRKLLQALQFTLPGCPLIYYGTELGMEGAADPQNRAPMRWDLVKTDNPVLSWVKKLAALHRSMPALRVGDFTPLDSQKLIAFTRTTHDLREAVIVLANPTAESVKEAFPTRIGRIMNWGELKDALSGEVIRSVEGMITVTLKPHQVQVLRPQTAPSKGASPYNRVN